MTVRVRGAEGGELEYASLEEAREALALGLIGPGDQVRLEPGGPWQPVSALGPPRRPAARRGPSWNALAIGGVALLAALAVALLRADQRLAGLALAFAAASLLLTVLGLRATRRR